MKIVVVGGGVSGAHAALTLLERGLPVELWDVGREENDFPLPGVPFDRLREQLEDPISHFLGSDLSAVVPAGSGELLRYPPSRSFLAAPDDPLSPFPSSSSFQVYQSFHRGGLANGWGANALTFDDDDLTDWPISSDVLAPAYARVQSRIPIAGPEHDALSERFPHQRPNQPAVPLSAADRHFVGLWERRRDRLADERMFLGRARLAVVTQPGRLEQTCDLCNRCLWGCPRHSIYNPAVTTLRACEEHPTFRYRRHRQVLRLDGRDGRITAIEYRDTRDGTLHRESCDLVVLAAGALGSGAIFLRTLAHTHPELAEGTVGLMDTRVVKIPYLLPGRIGRPPEERMFQFNRLILAVMNDTPGWPRHLHGEILHLGALLDHPLIEALPLGSRIGNRFFHALRPALGVVSLFFPDRPVAGNRMELADPPARPDASLRLIQHDSDDHRRLRQDTIRRVRALLRRLGCLPRPAVVSPPGAGIHYAGTLPMGSAPQGCDVNGRSNLFRNLYLADGAAFPTLPSKSLTLTLAAHATRVATHLDPTA